MNDHQDRWHRWAKANPELASAVALWLEFFDTQLVMHRYKYNKRHCPDYFQAINDEINSMRNELHRSIPPVQPW